MSVGYNKNKVEDFNNKLNNFLNNKRKYFTSLETFNTTISTVINNYRNAPTDNENTFYSVNGIEYVLTPENILMKTNKTKNDGPTIDSSLLENNENKLVNINGKMCFYSDIIYENTKGNKKASNRYVQVGLGKNNKKNELKYNKKNSHLNKIYKVNDNSELVFNNNEKCDAEFLYKCDGYSKMNGKRYYGIGNNGGVSNNDCECYVMDQIPSERIEQEILSIDVTNALLGDNTFTSNYLGIMMDGNAYALNDNNFSGNFNNVYEPNPNKHIAIFDTTKVEKSDCNMYTGSGVYGININSLGETSCVKK